MPLPATLSTPVVAVLLGCSRATVAAAGRGDGLRVGERVIPAVVIVTRKAWPTRPLLAALGVSEAEAPEVIAEAKAVANRKELPRRASAARARARSARSAA